MKTPEEWSREIYDKCHSPVMGRASVKPEFVAEIQADARKDLISVLRTVLASARPHPMENGQMYHAWEEARKVLDSQNV